MPFHHRSSHIKNCRYKINCPNNEDTPAKCKLKIAKSTAPPECASIPDKGGYTVQPVPAPFLLKKNLIIIKMKEVITKSLYYLIEGKPYPEQLSLLVQTITKTSNHCWHYHKKNHYKCMCSYYNIYN